jgi:hypothetical protein
MARRNRLRFSVLAVLALPAAIILFAAFRAQAQQHVNWYCSKCNSLVGSSPSAPKYCPKCKAPLRSFGSGSSTSKPATPPRPQVSSSPGSAKEGGPNGVVVGFIVCAIGLVIGAFIIVKGSSS